MNGRWSVLAVLRAGREQIRLGASDSAMGAIRAVRVEVPPQMRDQAYFSLMETAARAGEEASLATLAQPREATLALFDAAIDQLAAKLH